MFKHKHKLVPVAIDHPATVASGLTGVPGNTVRSVVLFRCTDGCTDPAAYAELKMVGKWILKDLDPDAPEQALFDEHVAGALSGVAS